MFGLKGVCVCAVVGEVMYRSVFAVKVVGGGSDKLIDGKRMFCVRDGKRKTHTHIIAIIVV